MGEGQGQMSDALRSLLGARLCQVQQRALEVITSQRYLCVCNQGTYTDNSADAVNQLLIFSSVCQISLLSAEKVPGIPVVNLASKECLPAMNRLLPHGVVSKQLPATQWVQEFLITRGEVPICRIKNKYIQSQTSVLHT